MPTGKILSSILFLLLCNILSGGEKPNVLFIAVDDLRVELGCYGHRHIRSPNIDRLASGGVLFEKSYCMSPTCGPSRAAIMSGLRPTAKRFNAAAVDVSKLFPDVVTLNTHFRNNGYATLVKGKVFGDPKDSVGGWDEKPWIPKSLTYASPEAEGIAREAARLTDGKVNRGPPYECADVPDDFYPDGQTLEKGIADLRRLAGEKKPFFYAIGFFRPHLPFNAPKKYWDLYPEDSIELPENAGYQPKNAPPEAFHTSGEVRNYGTVPREGPFSKEMQINLTRGYYACVSYVDALIGRLLDELDRLKLSDDTIVVLWGDHGWQLGEHMIWGKHCVFENSMRAPLIIRIPGGKAGVRVSVPVELIDVYPTLCALTKLPEPKPGQLQGKNLMPLIEHGGQGGKYYAVGRFRAGDTIFDGRFRYSEYREKNGRGELTGRMLYDHRNDPRENVNVVDDPVHRPIVEILSKELRRVRTLP